MAAACTSGLLLVGHQAAAQPAPPSPPASAPAPDQTSATFGDWTLRCDRRLDLTPPQRVCELALLVHKPGEAGALAQIAVGRVAAGEPLMITAVVPPNAALRTRPKVVVDGRDPSSVELSWSRCIAGACFADAALPSALLDGLRSGIDAGQLHYRDGTGREMTLVLSLQGARSALEALAREEAN